jgi:hypothetical protein
LRLCRVRYCQQRDHRADHSTPHSCLLTLSRRLR